MTYKDVTKALTANGWKLVRVCGSIYLYRKPGNPNVIRIAHHGSKDLSIGHIKDIEKKSGLTLR